MSSSVQVVALSSLAASVVMGPTGATAWVTSAAVGGPVQGATVWLFSTSYDVGYWSPLMRALPQLRAAAAHPVLASLFGHYGPRRGSPPPPQKPPVKAGKCTTDDGGVCTMPLVAADLSASYWPLVGVVALGSDALFIPSAGFFSSHSTPTYVGKLVVDSLLALPGSTVHVTGGVPSAALGCCPG